jgi:hypothetical protein
MGEKKKGEHGEVGSLLRGRKRKYVASGGILLGGSLYRQGER